MAGGFKMGGGVLTKRVVAAADVPAGETHPQFVPGLVRGQAFLAAFGGFRLSLGINLIKVRTISFHIVAA
jgi:hypothetical protein